jgi:hypothetical protein
MLDLVAVDGLCGMLLKAFDALSTHKVELISDFIELRS